MKHGTDTGEIGDVAITHAYLHPESCRDLKLRNVNVDEDDNVSFNVSQGASLLEVIDDIATSLMFVTSHAIQHIPCGDSERHSIRLRNAIKLFFINQLDARQLYFPCNKSIQSHIIRHFGEETSPWFGCLLAIEQCRTMPTEFIDLPIDNFALMAVAVAV